MHTKNFSRPSLAFGSLALVSALVSALASFGIALTAISTFAQAADAPRPAADLYRDFCAVCHSGGWQGAPIANEANEWTERMSAGPEAMLKNVKQGLNAMPPYGHVHGLH